jgi:hypothetical protein
MPVCERDPWRYQFFDRVPCPDEVLIPTDDPDSWNWYPEHRWVYDKLRIAASQGLPCGPHGVAPDTFPVFSKPLINLKGMGIGGRIVHTAAELDRHYTPGHMWMALLTGPHISTDCAVENGEVKWSRQTTGSILGGGMFDHWTVHAVGDPVIDRLIDAWVAKHMAGYTGMMNFETIGGGIIEVHLRFADQWCDLYGEGWVEALVRLYREGRWHFDDRRRRDGYSLPLFARHGRHYFHPSTEHQAAVRAMPEVTSLQITFYEDKPPEDHPMPPGGFRLGIVNATSLEAGCLARRRLAEAFPAEAILWRGDAAAAMAHG